MTQSVGEDVHWLHANIKPYYIRDLSICIKKQRYYFVNKGPSSQGYGFSSGQVWM